MYATFIIFNRTVRIVSWEQIFIYLFYFFNRTVRIGSWEQSIIWEEKIRNILSMKYKEHEFNIMMLIRLVEGLLITLVKEVSIWMIPLMLYVNHSDVSNVLFIYCVPI